MYDAIDFRLKPEDRADDDQPVPDLQTLLIEQSELLQTAGSDAVQLLHVLDTVHDASELRRRVRLWAEELHAHIVPAMAAQEVLSQTIRRARLLTVVYATDDLGIR